MKIELFFNLHCECLIFCEQIRGKIKNRKFSQNLLKCCFPKSCVLINLPHGWGKMIQHAEQYKYSVKADSHQQTSTAVLIEWFQTKFSLWNGTVPNGENIKEATLNF